MRVRGQLCNQKRVCLLAASLAKRVTATHVDRRSSSQIRQREVDAAIPAESGPKQAEERLVLINWQELTVTKRPAFGRVDEAHDSEFRHAWFCHDFLLREVSWESLTVRLLELSKPREPICAFSLSYC